MHSRRSRRSSKSQVRRLNTHITFFSKINYYNSWRPRCPQQGQDRDQVCGVRPEDPQQQRPGGAVRMRCDGEHCCLRQRHEERNRRFRWYHRRDLCYQGPPQQLRCLQVWVRSSWNIIFWKS